LRGISIISPTVDLCTPEGNAGEARNIASEKGKGGAAKKKKRKDRPSNRRGGSLNITLLRRVSQQLGKPRGTRQESEKLLERGGEGDWREGRGLRTRKTSAAGRCPYGQEPRSAYKFTPTAIMRALIEKRREGPIGEEEKKEGAGADEISEEGQ